MTFGLSNWIYIICVEVSKYCLSMMNLAGRLPQEIMNILRSVSLSLFIMAVDATLSLDINFNSNSPADVTLSSFNLH